MMVLHRLCDINLYNIHFTTESCKWYELWNNVVAMIQIQEDLHEKSVSVKVTALTLWNA